MTRMNATAGLPVVHAEVFRSADGLSIRVACTCDIGHDHPNGSVDADVVFANGLA